MQGTLTREPGDMCAVVGYIGTASSRAYIFEGLARLEYRGYDSAGFACFDPKQAALHCIKTTGGIDNLKIKMENDPFDGHVGIGHTRWATHGVSTELNAHPHYNSRKTIMVVHNGIIENFSHLKQDFIRSGHIFYSDTDTEVIVHVFEQEFEKCRNVQQALAATVQRLQGAYACVIMVADQPDSLLVVRKGSPLCVGVGIGEMFVASDPSAFAGRTDKVIFLPDATFATISQNKVAIYDFSGTYVEPVVQILDYSHALSADKQQYEHYMLKEIYEQKEVIQNTVNYFRSLHAAGILWDTCGLDAPFIKQLEQIDFFACGTSAHAAQIASYFFEEVAQIRCSVFLASEARHRLFLHNQRALYCAISQSGETADTLEVVRMLKRTDMSLLSITNVATSTLVRESSGYLLTHAKKECAVAATKSFTAQVALLFLLAHRSAFEKGLITLDQFCQAESDLMVAAELLESSMKSSEKVIAEQYAPFYAQFKNFIFLGRQISFPFACEAALKLKEIAYCFVDVYPAGELKHGPLALVDETVPVVIFSVLDETVYPKLVSAAQEIKARRGHLIIFAFEGQQELCALADTVFVFPCSGNVVVAPLIMTGVMQLFAYHIARVLGRPIDRPRNLAKSVTVE